MRFSLLPDHPSLAQKPKAVFQPKGLSQTGPVQLPRQERDELQAAFPNPAIVQRSSETAQVEHLHPYGLAVYVLRGSSLKRLQPSAFGSIHI